MGGYLLTIQTSIFIFPVIACIITMPYVIWMYRKYGSINFIKTVIIYSFVLYLESCFLLVNLPLPNPGSVHNNYIDMINLIPFKFIGDFIRESPLRIFNISTYLSAVKHGTFFVPVFNILMLIPFGIYLRYYFKFSLKKTILFTALLSLFFDLVQLSGLFFIYKGPYRLCDIDDIIQNTLGGIIGYLIAGILCKILPTREEIDNRAIEKGKKVPGIRKVIAFLIDLFLIKVISLIIRIFVPIDSIFVFILYFTILPRRTGNTLGTKFLRFHLEMENRNYLKLLIRSLGMITYIYVFPWFVIHMMNKVNENINTLDLAAVFFIVFMIFVIYIIVTIYIILANRSWPFDKIFNMTYVSDIKTVDQKDKE